jgi:hypothetical protein
MTLGIMAHSVTTHSIVNLNAKLSTNDIRHNDTQHNDTQQFEIICNTEHRDIKTLSIHDNIQLNVLHFWYVECHYGGCHSDECRYPESRCTVF